MNTSGNKTSCTTAGAASALRIREATPAPSAQKQAAPSTRTTTIAAQWVGSGTPNSRPTPTMSAMSTTLTTMQWASKPRK
jgi:hypothetical protein